MPFPVIFQVPVDIRPNAITFIRIYDGRNPDFIRAVCTNVTEISALSMSGGQEYWYSKSITDVSSLSEVTLDIQTNQYGSSSAAQEAIQNFISGFTQSFDVAQAISSSGWSSSGYTIPSGSRTRLFKATDPDDSSKKLGMLIVQNSTPLLTDIVWYNTSQPSNGYLYQASSGAPSQTWDGVNDSSNNPSTSTSDIDSSYSGSWYHADKSST